MGSAGPEAPTALDSSWAQWNEMGGGGIRRRTSFDSPPLHSKSAGAATPPPTARTDPGGPLCWAEATKSESRGTLKTNKTAFWAEALLSPTSFILGVSFRLHS